MLQNTTTISNNNINEIHFNFSTRALGKLKGKSCGPITVFSRFIRKAGFHTDKLKWLVKDEKYYYYYLCTLYTQAHIHALSLIKFFFFLV